MGDKYTVINENSESFLTKIKEVFEFKDLFITLSIRDFKVRYAQAFLGFLWAFINPAITLVLLSIVFGRFLNVKTGAVPQVLITASGVVFWNYFSFVLTNAGSSLIASQSMVKKIYFPRLVIPISKGFVGLIDLVISLAILLALLFYYHTPLSVNFIFLPLIILINILLSLGVGIWISALSIRYRDVQYVVPFLVQIGLYVTPIAYTSDFIINHIPSYLSAVIYLNPMIGLLDILRWSLFGSPIVWSHCMVSVSLSFIIFFTGVIYFNKAEIDIADYL